MKMTPWPQEASRAFLDGIEDLSVVETNAGAGSGGPITTHCVANLDILYPDSHGIPTCPLCKKQSRNSAQKKVRSLYDKPLHSRPHTLNCYYDLFACKNPKCSKGTFAIQLKCAEPRARATKRLVDYIIECSLYDNTLNAAAKECGISSTAAYGIRQTEVRRRLKSEVRYQATEHMGIDETFLSLRQEDGKRGEKSLCYGDGYPPRRVGCSVNSRIGKFDYR